MKPFLSKSKYLIGIQCPKLLWYHYNAKDQLPAVDERTQAVFDQGHEVGALAKRRYPDGVSVDSDTGFEGALSQTTELLKLRKPLFEAAFMSNRTFARADVLVPVKRDQWDIVEVKMGSSVKDINYHDVAFQRHCYEGAGLRVGRCYLMHINREYVRQGAIDPSRLFVREDVTEQLADYSRDVGDRVAGMLKTIGEAKCPEQDIGPHCDDPYECPLKALCWKLVWKHDNHVFTLPRARGKDWDLYRRGILRNDKIPADFRLTAQQQIQVEAEKTGTPHIDKSAVRQFLDGLTFPAYFMDFETFGFSVPIPLMDNTRPYDQVPFQFSVHALRSLDAKPKHTSWLWDGEGDPRPGFLANLKMALGGTGSVVVYNRAFEAARLKECVAVCPEHADWVAATQGRLVDLLDLFRNFSVYYPSQHGSASIKAVLPALTGQSYADLPISDGGQASGEFLRVTFGTVAAEEKARVRADLERYCGLDTMGMVDILRAVGACVA